MLVLVRVRVVVRGHVLLLESSQPPKAPADRLDMPDARAPLDHENLDVYQCSLEFLRLALRIASVLPRGESELRAQLKTAAMSVPLNIAEGAGKPSPADRSHAHAIARGSAMECGALVDVCSIAGYVSADECRDGKVLLSRIVAMLTKMCR